MISCFSCDQLCATLWTVAHQAPLRDSPGNTGVGCHALLQGIFPIQESNPYLFTSPALQVDSLSLAPLGKPCNNGSQYNMMTDASSNPSTTNVYLDDLGQVS